jgi:hypothetical protein
VLKAFENGIENVVSFFTDGITAQQLEQLASLMDEKKMDTLSLFELRASPTCGALFYGLHSNANLFSCAHPPARLRIVASP